MISYAEAFPGELGLSLAIVPWGALEWHGAHLPLGLDGIVAGAFAVRLVEQEGGTLLPTMWAAMTTLPHGASLQVSTGTFAALAEETARGLFGAGFARVAFVSGHYAQGQMTVLYELGARLAAEGLPLYAATPLEPLGDPDLLDHAGWAEASQLLALRPELARLDRLSPEPRPHEDAVLGPHPAEASAQEGEALFARALEAWRGFLATGPEHLPAHYEEVQAQYAAYRAAFFTGSWEEAIVRWWATK